MSVESPEALAQRALPRAVQEVVDLLRQELAAVDDMLGRCRQGAGGEEEQLAEELARFAQAADAAGFEGLRQVLDFATANFGLAVATDGAAAFAIESISGLLGEIGDYLAEPGAPAASDRLVDRLGDAGWPVQLDAEERASIRAALYAPDLEAMDADTPPRPTQAVAADVTLALSAEVEPELLDSLLVELPGQTAEFSERVQRFLAGGRTEDVDAARRIVHTVKGAANTVGIVGVATLTHQLEDILDEYSKAERIPGAPVVDTLLRAADCLEAMSEALTGTAPAPDDAIEVLQSVLDWANRIDSDGLPDVDADPGDDGPTAAVSVSSAMAAAEADAGAADEDTPGNRPVLRVSAERVDSLLALMGEKIILTGQVQEGLRGGMQQIRSMRELFGQVQQLAYDLEQMVEVKGLSGPRSSAVGDDFDPLEMDEFNEFHTISSRMLEAATDAREMLGGLSARLTELDAFLVEQGRLNREAQDSVMLTRMLPVGTVVARLQRVVRQTARLTGKRAELTVAGETTLVDSGVLADLVDPLMHLLRNAVDHGLETLDERRRTGKPETGRVVLEFGREGAQVVVRCSDDGAGLDLDGIHAAAVSRGLLAPGQALDEAALTRLVFRPGLTTRGHATQISGRGVGMDVVHSTVAALGGVVDISSRAGAGCTVRLRLPLSVISTHALLVPVGRQMLAIANRGIEQILYGGSGEIQEVNGESRFMIDASGYPAVAIESLLGQPCPPASAGQAPRSVLLVQSDTGLRAVMVAAVIDSRDVVIKSLGRYLPRLPGIAGATILGDGRVAAVIDLPDLLRNAHNRQLPAAAADVAVVEHSETQLPGALVVDDSLSARRSMSRIMQEIGFQVRTARDGLEAVAMMAEFRPEIMLVDLEMPRMNGLELCSHIRAQRDIADIPIIMVTSRSTHKHREQAREVGIDAYFTKPISEDDLFDAVGRLYVKS